MPRKLCEWGWILAERNEILCKQKSKRCSLLLSWESKLKIKWEESALNFWIKPVINWKWLYWLLQRGVCLRLKLNKQSDCLDGWRDR